jgi:hypothetical protein
MIGHELAVEQNEAGQLHPRHQPGERHFRRIGAAREHALAEKCPAQRHAIEAADQFIAIPAFDRMGKTALMQVDIGCLDLAVDPGRRPVGRRFGAFADNGLKICVDRYPEAFTPHRSGQGMRQAKAFEGQYGAMPGLDPVDFVGVAIVRHRKNTDAIGP